MGPSTSPFDTEAQRRKRLWLSFAGMLGVLLWGTLGLMWIEGWDFAKALYFTLITVTTVGYGDEGISSAGRVFALAFLVIGIGVCSYSFAYLVQSMVASNLSWKRRMQNKIDRTNAHVIVCGFGRMGRIVCKELTDGGRTLVVIEPGERAFHEAVAAGYLALEGSAADDETLRAAGVERATDAVSLAPTLADNIAIVLTARELGPHLKIQTRAECEAEVRKLRRAGADRIVSPFRTGGIEVATAILRPKVAEFLARTSQDGEGGIALGDVRVEPGSMLDGRTLADYGRNEAAKLAFVSLEREGEAVHIPPSGRQVLQAGDHLVVAGDPAAVVQMREHGLAPGGRRTAA